MNEKQYLDIEPGTLCEAEEVSTGDGGSVCGYATEKGLSDLYPPKSWNEVWPWKELTNIHRARRGGKR